MIIDTHCHLDDKQYEEDLDKVLKRAQESGVAGILIPAADINDIQRARTIAHLYSNIYFAVGIHPYHHLQYNESVLREFAKDEKCIAIGECGLDYSRLPEDADEQSVEKEAQKRVFSLHVRLAKELKKPLIVHIRDANDDSKKVLLDEQAGEVGGVLHCYNASEHLLDLADKGFYFGIGGVVTFKNAKKLVEILLKIPLEKLLIETDGPYLSPTPHRGERNEPAYTLLVAEKMAQILGISKEEVSELTTKNAMFLFKEFTKTKQDKLNNYFNFKGEKC
ncbi:MAG: TatD family hydrolase [Sulfurospirillaceae bacterium]|nr:TatD family hydrolase [Sulfurospirillaceae bacterium]